MPEARNTGDSLSETDRTSTDRSLSDTDSSSSLTLSTAASSWEIGDPQQNCVRCGRFWLWGWMSRINVCQCCRDTAVHMATVKWCRLTLAYLHAVLMARLKLSLSPRISTQPSVQLLPDPNAAAAILEAPQAGIVCLLCGQASDALFTCGNCRTARYCCRRCQKKDWGRHRGVCSPPVVVRVATMSAEITTFDCLAGATVRELKHMFSQQGGPCGTKLGLVCGTRVLSDWDTLQAAGVDEETMVTVVGHSDIGDTSSETSDSTMPELASSSSDAGLT